jgi:hypothetical protein
MKRLLRALYAGVTLSLAFLVVSCGPTRTAATGKVLKGGAPLTVSDKGLFIISLISEEGGKSVVHPVDWKPDGTFTAHGPDRKGLPLGTYKVSVQAFDPYPGKDMLNGEFTPEKTKLTADVKSGSEIVVDVGKK